MQPCFAYQGEIIWVLNQMVFSKQISVFSSKWSYWHDTAHYKHDSNDRLICLDVYLPEYHNYAQFISHHHMEDIYGNEKRNCSSSNPHSEHGKTSQKSQSSTVSHEENMVIYMINSELWQDLLLTYICIETKPGFLHAILRANACFVMCIHSFSFLQKNMMSILIIISYPQWVWIWFLLSCNVVGIWPHRGSHSEHRHIL